MQAGLGRGTAALGRVLGFLGGALDLLGSAQRAGMLARLRGEVRLGRLELLPQPIDLGVEGRQGFARKTAESALTP